MLNHPMGDPLSGHDGALAGRSYDGHMSRVKMVGLSVLGLVVPFVLAFTAWNLSRSIGAPGVPPVPNLVHRQDQGGRAQPSSEDRSGPSGGATGTPAAPSAPGVTPSPTDDHGGGGSNGSGPGGPGSGDDSSNSGPGSGGSGSSGSGSGSGSGGGSGDD